MTEQIEKSSCLFCRIASNDLPSNRVYEDESFVAFYDIRPVAPVHILIIPRVHIARLDECNEQHEQMLGKMQLLAIKLMHKLGCDNGFRTAFNCGQDGGQEVYHLHLHAMGGPRPWKTIVG